MLVVFVLLFGYHAVWIWQGFDVTDEGFNLTNQWLIASSPEHYQWRTFNASIWLSDLLGGLWLKVVGGLGLIGARLGWVLVKALTGVIAFLALQRFFPRPLTLIAVVATAAALSFDGTLTIDYNNIPVLLLVSATALLLASQDVGVSRQRRRSYALAAGTLLGLCAMARFPLVLALLLPFVSPIVQTTYGGRASGAPEWRLPFQAVLAACMAVTVCLLWLAAAGHLHDYMAGIGGLFAVSADSSHSVVSLLRTYAGTTRSALLSGIAILTTGYGFLLLVLAVLWMCADGIRTHVFHRPERTGAFFSRFNGYDPKEATSPRGARWPLIAIRSMRWMLVLGSAAGLSLLMYHVLRSAAPDASRYALVLPGLCLIWCVVALLSAVMRGRGPSRPERVTLLLIAAAVAVLKMIGSNNGIYSAIEGLWILMPAVLLVTLSPVWSPPSLREPGGQKPPRSERSRVQYAGLVLAVAALASAGAAGATIRYSNPYRDLTSRAALTTGMSAPLVQHVYTSPARAESFGDLLGVMAQVTRPGDVVLAWDSIPMVHFATQTIPALGTPWPNLLEESDLRSRMKQMWEAGGPAAVVAMKVDTRNRTWAVKDEPAPKRSSVDLGAECLAHGYALAWQSLQFAVWLPPGK